MMRLMDLAAFLDRYSDLPGETEVRLHLLDEDAYLLWDGEIRTRDDEDTPGPEHVGMSFKIVYEAPLVS